MDQQSFQKKHNKPYHNKKKNDENKDRFNSEENASFDEEDTTGPMLVFGRNAVREALKSDQAIDKLFIMEGEPSGSLRELLGMAREKHIVIQSVGKAKLDAMTTPFAHRGELANHQGIVAQMPAITYVEIEDMLASARDKNEKPFLLVLDGLQDPHNLGAILRTAECAGVHGVIIPKRRAVSVTAAVAKASAGASMYVNVARVPNLVSAVEKLKKENVWIIGAEANETKMSDVQLDGAIALVIGHEGTGLSKSVRDHCDLLVSIPMYGEINSLNASNAAAILMYEKLRQDHR